MAMTKKEQAEVEAIRVDAALRWPTYDEPKPVTDFKALPVYDHEADKLTWATPSDPIRIAWGFSTPGAYGPPEVSRRLVTSTGLIVERAGMGGSRLTTSYSRERRKVYATAEEARRACRWEMCRDYAAKLRALDALELPNAPAL